MIRASFASLKGVIATLDAKLFEEIPDLVNPLPKWRSVPNNLDERVKKVIELHKEASVIETSVLIAINAFLLQPKMDNHLTEVIITEMFGLIKFCAETERFSDVLQRAKNPTLSFADKIIWPLCRIAKDLITKKT